MEDWQDEQAEVELMRQADEEERMIKQVGRPIFFCLPVFFDISRLFVQKKLDAIKAQDDLRAVKEREEKERQQKERELVQPGLEEAEKQALIDEEIKRRQQEEEDPVKEGSLRASHNPRLQKIASMTNAMSTPPPKRMSQGGASSPSHRLSTGPKPVPAPRRDSRVEFLCRQVFC